MKRYIIMAAAISIGLFGCREDDNGGTPNNPNQPDPNFANPFLDGTNISSDFTGRITDMNGNPVSGALVTIGSSFTTTDSRGFYQINNTQVDKGFALVRVTASNYFDQYRNLKPRQNEMNFVDIALLNLVYTSAFNASEGGVVDVVGGGSVTFSANGVVDADGQPYNGQVVIASAYLDPTDIALPSYIPGSLAAVDDEGQGVGMITYGMVGVEMIGSSGQPLQLAEGTTASIKFPIQAPHAEHAPDEIPLWYFDETVGVWYQEGSAVKVGNMYEGEVEHFSFWNCDISFNTAYLEGTLVNAGNAPLTALYVRVYRPNGQYAHSSVNAEGYFGGIVPAGEALTLEFFASPCGTEVIYSMDVPALSGDLNLGEINVTSNFSILTLSGTAEDCDGNPVGGLVVIADASENGSGSYAVSNPDGSFSMTLMCLTSGALSVDLIDFASATQVSDLSVSYDMGTSSVYDMGDVSFCDVEDLEMYFTYNEGDFDFSFPFVQSLDSSGVCLGLFGSPEPGVTAGISLDFGYPTSIGPAPVCNLEGAFMYYYYTGTQESYTAQMSNYEVVITDFEMVDDEYTLIEGTYTADVAVNGFIDGTTINYNAVATGGFRFVEE